ncbi:uncharacterized protein LOC130622457 [Hydractinia symbiolongicarpus]|uniref:uncharacterized protein LOC130622457 n=1 Tax=Hydractinia symbiolongicarpus TaxID=13093 RepID=UPI0025518E21|nr:uncharacterized protein LOC130622457 [Hydractinia symbiolongicarpus]
MGNQQLLSFVVLFLFCVEKVCPSVPNVKVKPGTGQCDSECSEKFVDKWYIWVPLLIVLILVCAIGGFLRARKKICCTKWRNLKQDNNVQHRPNIQNDMLRDPRYMFSAYDVYTESVNMSDIQNEIPLDQSQLNNGSPVFLIDNDPPSYKENVDQDSPSPSHAHSKDSQLPADAPPTYSSLFERQ